MYSPPTLRFHIDLDLSRNEGRTRAAELLATLADPDRVVSRYPNVSGLRARLAALRRVGEDQVLVTAGGDDALNRCFQALVTAKAVSTYPSFEMIPRYAEQRGAELVEVEWWTGPFPVERMEKEASEAEAVFVVSPNNPTGAALSGDDLRRISAAAPVVVLDAAYVEFGDEDLTPLALEMGNVAVIRTLSKAYGLAGLRVGYLLAPPPLVARVAAYGNPYPVSSISTTLAQARLDRPEAETTGFVARIREERERLGALLAGLDTRPFPSQANFVLTETERAAWLVDAAGSLGIALRRFPTRPGLEDKVRITVPGDGDDFARLVATLTAALRPEALIFDLDGVLADVSRSQTVAIIETAAELGAMVTSGDVERAKAAGDANNDWELTRRLCAEKGVEVSLEEVTARYEARYQGTAAAAGLKEQEEALVDAETWRRWTGRFPVAVVTGRPRADAEEFLARFGMLDGLAALVAMEDAPLKPDPASVRLALERLGVSSAWMLGDTRDDVEAARAAGVVPIGVVAPGDDPVRTRAALGHAARVLDRVTDLEELLP